MSTTGTPSPRDHLTETEAADYLCKSVATLRRWRWRRIGPAWSRPPGSKAPLYLRGDLESWIRSGRVDPRGDE
jgi:hypothetical protein